MGAWITFLTMGGYAAYVWPAYGITLLVLIGMLAHARCQRKNLSKKLVQWFRE